MMFSSAFLGQSFRLISVILCCASLSAPSFAARELDENSTQFKQWLANVVERAKGAGVSDDTIYDSLNNVKLIKKVVKLDKKQPFKVKTFNQYLDSIVPKSRIKKANKMYNKHRTLLNKIGKEYGVQPRFIVALWGIESNFGRNMGRTNIIDALTTLAYEGRREEFFTKELINALKIIDQGNISKKKMKGSWAGAMGQTQFMPSSYLELAVDYDKDGKKDIWHNQADAFASIANYLSKRGWNNKLTWGREAKLPSSFSSKLLGKETEKNLVQWSQIGVKKANGRILPQRDDVLASIIKPESDKERAYVIYNNYKILLKWNRSLYFATAVGILSDGIKENF